MGLIDTARRFFRGLKERKGFTLPEVAAVVAITGTLAAVIVPVAIDQIESARIARAKQDVDGIQSAISAFHRDTGTWPTRETSDPDAVEVLRSGNTLAGSFTLFNATPSTGNVPDPDVGDTNWAATTTGALVNHLTLDNPGGTTTTANDDYVDAGVNWNGPYMPQIFNDPWGRNYLVYAKAFTSSTATLTEGGGASDIYVWIISGGPNETLETNVTSPILNDDPTTGLSTEADDIGLMMFRAREGVAGVSGGS